MKKLLITLATGAISFTMLYSITSVNAQGDVQKTSPIPTFIPNESGIPAVYEEVPPAHLPATIVIADWLSTTPTEEFQTYHIEFGTRVFVERESSGHYLISWVFDVEQEPMFGWISIESVLLDRDVRY